MLQLGDARDADAVVRVGRDRAAAVGPVPVAARAAAIISIASAASAHCATVAGAVAALTPRPTVALALAVFVRRGGLVRRVAALPLLDLAIPGTFRLHRRDFSVQLRRKPTGSFN